ncbi:MAG: hypothetical protein JSV88_02415 [Candidatus Aminicenantes bacterium]|nr:MAG: hypothetical protein JSV88_02415 [Candidatus Aminicenantes bacterium]
MMMKELLKAKFIKMLCCVLCVITLAYSQTNKAQDDKRFSKEDKKKIILNLKQKVMLPGSKAFLGVYKQKLVKVDSENRLQIVKEFKPNQEIKVTGDENRLGILNRIGEGSYTFEMRKITDEVLFKIEDKPFNYFLVSPLGKFVVGIRSKDILPTPRTTYTYYFYSSQGIEKGKVGPFMTKNHSFSPDGQAFVLNSRKQGLIAFGPEGNILWQVQGNYWSFAVSNGARYVVSGSDGKPYFLKGFKMGKEIWHLDSPNRVTGISISSNGNYASVGDIGSLKFINVNNGSIEWKRLLKDEEHAVTSMSVSNEGLIAFSTEKKIPARQGIPQHFGSDKIFIYGPKGERLLERNASYSYWKGGPPELKFTDDSQVMFFGIPEKNLFIDCREYKKRIKKEFKKKND